MSTTLKNALIHAYIRDMGADNPSDRDNILYFDYIPEEIADSKTANYNLIDIPGRSEPVVGYVNSGLREFSLHLMFVAGVGQTAHPDPKNELNITVNSELSIWLESISQTSSSSLNIFDFYPEDNVAAVKRKTDWLRSLIYPDYTKQYANSPHTVLLSIGQLIKSICIVPSVSVVYKAPWDGDLLPYIAEVDINFQEVNTIPMGYTIVRQGTLSSGV